MTGMLSLVVAFAGYSIHAIAQAGQKIGLAVAGQRRARGLLIWVLSTLSMPSSAFMILYAVSIGNASLVGAMSGSGLASLAVFSHLYMHERIRRQELVAVVMIIVAAIVIGLFQVENAVQHTGLSALYIYIPSICCSYLLLWILFRRRDRVAGIVIAGLAGALGGAVPLFQKVSASAFGRSHALLDLRISSGSRLGLLVERGSNLLSNPWALAWIAISVISMVVMQFAYRRGKAIQLIPAFAANTIAVPVAGGVVAFREQLHPLQWLGVIIIIAGVLLLTVKPDSS